MFISKRHLEKIAKKNFIIDFELLKTLEITKTEAIILDQIAYLNKKYEVISLSIEKLTEITQISRGHFYRCLKNLIAKDLLCKNENGLFVTDNYKEAKLSTFKKSHEQALAKAKKEVANKSEKMLDSLSQNETKVSQNETNCTIYNNTISTMCITHSRDIKRNCKSEFCNFKQSKQVLGLATLLNEGKEVKGFKEHKLEMKQLKELFALLQDKKQEADNIQLKETITTEIEKFKETKKDVYNELIDFLNQLSYTGIFFSAENKELMFENVVDSIRKGKNIREMIDFSIKNNLLWLCDNEDDSIGKEALNKVLDIARERLKEQETQIIRKISVKYKGLLLQFLQYREQKNRAMNTFGLKKLCLTLQELENKGISIVDSINQSIERGYNWVFKPTNRANYRYYRYSKKAVA